MTNLFDFSYDIQSLNNKDNSKSRFAVVYGQGGNIVHTKKDSYHVVPTEEFSALGQAFIENGYEGKVRPFVQKNGEVIGLNILFDDKKLTEVGDKEYRAIITLPNNGNGKGTLSIHETRLICANGMTRSKIVGKEFNVKIPHTIDYKRSLELMKESINGFLTLIEYSENFDGLLNNQKLENEIEVTKVLNKWFFENEYPDTQKHYIDHNDNKVEITFDMFRKFIALDTEKIKCYDRYEMMIKCFNNELEHNKTLGLDLSMYTAYATITNYISRRIEKSQSKAEREIQFQRAESKVRFFEQYV